MDEFIQKASNLTEMNNAIDTVKKQISDYNNNTNIMNMIKNMDNLTTYFNNYIFEIQTISLSFKEKLESIRTYYNNNKNYINLNFITTKYNSIKNGTSGDELYDNFKSFKADNCNADCKSKIDEYITQSTLTDISKYEELLSLIKGITDDGNINTFVYDPTNPFPYTFYRELAENIKTELPNYGSELEELISSFFFK